ncbi:putative tail protein [Pectobacterium phage DU_PP_V]|uniref:Putative tail protein n=1 Tax=Pectobacterium phage DU_PP_V TaxID=2041492 RepID=A0A2D2W790_9CAUD|nr:straight fibre tail protein [Pectobacterium phage DU_PP_V]ATS94093.1 putative tail protein [Pectobacterium phage DU_PP_V]
MIVNNATEKLIIQSLVASYTKVYILHSIYRDYDVVGRSFWTSGPGGVSERRDITDTSINFVTLSSFVPNAAYTIRGAFFDAMVDSELLGAQIGINLSDPTTFTTKVYPTITSANSIAESVDVGVGPPRVTIGTSGDADYCVIEFKLVGSTQWVRYYTGPISPSISFSGVPIGQYNVRISGFITLPDGTTTESSIPYEFPGVLDVKYNFVPPTAPKNMRFRVARIQDGKERYDLRVEWDWEKETGANVREFSLHYIESSEYAATGWSKAQVINVGAARAATITSFPLSRTYRFKVSSIAWGPDTQAVTESDPVEFILTPDTPLDSSFTNETGIEVNYAHIKGTFLDSGVRKQSFLIDAATGSVSLGALDGQGRAPISFDPVSKIVNVDGSVITKSIYSASFILTNLTGEDNPAIYSQGKSWGDANSGIWMGIDNTTLKPKFDLGNSTQYIRYDGDTLRISGQVVLGTPNGDIPLGEGIQGKQTVFIYIAASTTPATPTNSGYPPPGWATTPPARDVATQNIYVSTGTLDPITNTLVSGTSWSTPVQWSGSEGSSEEGGRGAGIYTQPVPGTVGFNVATANAFFNSNFGSGPVLGDVLTQYRPETPSIAYTRYWNGTAWGTPDLVVHGDMIVNGTIPNAKILDATITGAKIADATITNAKIANATIESAKIKDAAITRAKIAETINSDNYVPNTTGTSLNFATGVIEMNGGTAGAGRMNIKNDRIIVYDDNNQVAVVIGRRL